MAREEITTQEQLYKLVRIRFKKPFDTGGVLECLSHVANRLGLEVRVAQTSESIFDGETGEETPERTTQFTGYIKTTPLTLKKYGPFGVGYRIEAKAGEDKPSFREMQLDARRVEPEMPSFKDIATLVQDVHDTVRQYSG